ncbi:MAG TPA: cysteine rich repeat-containing protein [Caulobacteraceae bacterium]
MKHSILAAGALALGVLVAQAAAAQPQGMAAVRQACAADLKKYCADVQPGGGRIGECMRAHVASLSGACKSALMQARQQKGGVGAGH